MIIARKKFISNLLFFIFVGVYFLTSIIDYKGLDIKYIILCFNCVIWGMPVLIQFTMKRGLTKLYYFDEFKNIIKAIAVLAIISVGFQIINGQFKLYLLKEIFFFAMPIITVFLISNYDKQILGSYYFDIILYCSIIYFIKLFGSQLSVEQLFNISFINSYSPYESILADYFFLCCMHYAYTGQKYKFIISAFFCLLAFKRIHIIFLTLLILYNFVLHSNKIKYYAKGMVNKKLIKITVLIFCISPFIIYIILTDKFSDWFYLYLGLNINDFTMGRIDLINALIDSQIINYGLGTTTYFISNIYNGAMSAAGNLHNDVFRIYYECTLVGTIVFTYMQFKNASKSYWSYFLALFLFSVMLTSHILTNTLTLIMFYLLISEFNYFKFKRKYNYQIKEA
ncbi:MAG: hypothetical protein K0R21_25 [Anaerocolumna sp.]|nr:hypothetical protein [Anaerocolumna sp.]